MQYESYPLQTQFGTPIEIQVDHTNHKVSFIKDFPKSNQAQLHEIEAQKPKIEKKTQTIMEVALQKSSWLDSFDWLLKKLRHRQWVVYKPPALFSAASPQSPSVASSSKEKLPLPSDGWKLTASSVREKLHIERSELNDFLKEEDDITTLIDFANSRGEIKYQNVLVEWYESNLNRTNDEQSEDFKNLENMAKDGNVEAQFVLAQFFEKNKANANKERAIEWCEKIIHNKKNQLLSRDQLQLACHQLMTLYSDDIHDIADQEFPLNKKSADKISNTLKKLINLAEREDNDQFVTRVNKIFRMIKEAQSKYPVKSKFFQNRKIQLIDTTFKFGNKILNQLRAQEQMQAIPILAIAAKRGHQEALLQLQKLAQQNITDAQIELMQLGITKSGQQTINASQQSMWSEIAYNWGIKAAAKNEIAKYDFMKFLLKSPSSSQLVSRLEKSAQNNLEESLILTEFYAMQLADNDEKDERKILQKLRSALSQTIQLASRNPNVDVYDIHTRLSKILIDISDQDNFARFNYRVEWHAINDDFSKEECLLGKFLSENQPEKAIELLGNEIVRNKNNHEAATILRNLAKGGDLRAHLKYLEIYKNLKQKEREGQFGLSTLIWAIKAAEKDPKAKIELASIFTNKIPPLTSPEIAQGLSLAYVKQAHHHFSGEGNSLNKIAKEYAEKAEKQGIPGMMALAEMHASNFQEHDLEGIPPDTSLKEATRLYRQAAHHNHQPALVKLAEIYTHGSKFDIKNIFAQENVNERQIINQIAQAYLDGHLKGSAVENQPELLFNLLDAASANNDLRVISKLAEMHQKGIGTKADQPAAHALYFQAFLQGTKVKKGQEEAEIQNLVELCLNDMQDHSLLDRYALSDDADYVIKELAKLSLEGKLPGSEIEKNPKLRMILFEEAIKQSGQQQGQALLEKLLAIDAQVAIEILGKKVLHEQNQNALHQLQELATRGNLIAREKLIQISDDLYKKYPFDESGFVDESFKQLALECGMYAARIVHPDPDQSERIKTQLANMYFGDESPINNKEKRIEGYARVCTNAALKYFEEDHPDNAFELFKEAANENYPQAVMQHAKMLLNGIGTPKDPKSAFEQFKKAADQNFQPAIRQIAKMYEEGIGIERNPREAFALYNTIDQDESTLMQLAKMHLEGIGTEQNREEGIALLERAAELNFLPAFEKLGDALEKTDPDRAVIFFGKSALEYEESPALNKLKEYAFKGNLEAQKQLIRVADKWSAEYAYDQEKANQFKKMVAQEWRDRNR